MQFGESRYREIIKQSRSIGNLGYFSRQVLFSLVSALYFLFLLFFFFFSLFASTTNWEKGSLVPYNQKIIRGRRTIILVRSKDTFYNRFRDSWILCYVVPLIQKGKKTRTKVLFKFLGGGKRKIKRNIAYSIRGSEIMSIHKSSLAQHRREGGS